MELVLPLRIEPGIDEFDASDPSYVPVEGIVSRHPGERVVLFTHSGAINASCGHALGQQRALWFAPDYASVSRIGAARDGRRGVISLNETPHVRDLLPQA